MVHNPAHEYVTESRGVSPVHAYVAEQGNGVARSEIEHTTLTGRSVALAATVTAEERAMIADRVLSIDPVSNECFRNTLRLWELDDRFHYVEGFAVRSDLDVGGVEHAWALLDGEKLVDPTTAFDHYFGVRITDADILQRYADESPNHGVLGNHTDRFAYLRERGFIGDGATGE